MSDEGEFDDGEDCLEDEEICDYTGDMCIGDKLFCEECPIFTQKNAEKEGVRL